MNKILFPPVFRILSIGIMAYNSLFLVALKAFVVLISAQAALGTPVGGILIDGAEVRTGHGSLSLCDQCTMEMRHIFLFI